MAGLLTISNEVVKKLDSSPYPNIHPPAFPFVAVGTYLFARLRPEDIGAWRLPKRKDIINLGKGLGIGTIAISTLYAIACQQGWINAPRWGWEMTSKAAVHQSMLLQILIECTTAWNEEMIFRGYGLDTLQESLDTSGGIAVSALLFAFYHDISALRLLNMVLFALVMTIQRVESGSIWMPIGFHFAWNFFQYAILGPNDSMPSLRPVAIIGPEKWIGIPGIPERGWLSAIILGTLVIWLGIRYWLRHSPK
jgi:membrane protease YdiL (CAAX protease family)